MERVNLCSVPLRRLVSDALHELERLGYSRRSCNRYRRVWEYVIEYCDRNKAREGFSEDLAARFLEEQRAGEQSETRGQGWRRHIVWGVRMLVDFAEHGSIERAFVSAETIDLVPAMEKTLNDYLQYCRDRLQLRPSTIQGRTTELRIFLNFLHTRKGRTLDQIQSADLSDFISARADLPRVGGIRREHWLQPKTMARIVSDLRSFLRFLMMRGFLHKDLTAGLPIIRLQRDAKIPSVWEHGLIIKLLEAVDRSSAKGKRDYAILLLASRLGLRVGDIRTLTLDQLRWENSTIELTQSKTDTPLVLPLTGEVGDALIDYLKSGRPQTAYREVFLKVKPPFDPFTENHLHHIVTYWRKLAGIHFRAPQKRGFHSLRHTLATRLMEKGAPFTLIAEILGHTSLETTRIYAKASVEALRTVALDPEEALHVG
jgi:site-specific recombinase XerD